jgi:hypothetical protein
MKHYPLKTSIILIIVYAIFMGVLPFAWAAQIGLAWDANGESDLAGYKVYYGTASQSYGTPINVGNVTSYTLTGLTQGQTYYVSVTAYDTSNYESNHSSEVSGAATDPAQSVAITIATSPTSLSITVDGTSYTAPQTFNWTAGSSHSIGVTSPQGTSTTRRVFSSWSDAGAQSHSITVPSSAATYTAAFATQHALATSVSPSGAGTVSPSGTNWYNSGTSVSLSATASAGYSFSNWSGSLTHSTNPTSITLDQPKSVTANFSAVAETITVPSVPSGPSSGTTGVSYAFTTGGASSSLSDSLEYQFDWKGDGTDLSSWGSTSQSKTWTAAGTYAVRARARCATHTSVLSSWSSSLSVLISAASVSCTITTAPTGLQISVDGTSYTAPQTLNWTAGASHSIGVTSPQGTSTTRWVFSSWSDAGAQSHSITVPSSAATYTAAFTTQHALVTSVSPSGAGTVSPSGTNWYNSGTSVTLSATASTGYSFSNWSGSLTHSTNPTSITLDEPKSVTANFSAVAETITVPSVPSGPSSGTTGVSYTFTTGGASSSLGHSVQYQFDWKGDATDLSGWGSASQSKTWSTSGTYGVRARARCASDTSVISSWSNALTVTIGQGGISYTVTTSPSSLQITVDGTDLTAPKTFSWTPGSSHTISVSSPQNGVEGTRYLFSSWSDGGTQSHSITAPSSSATYTANFTTQYTLKTSPDPAEGGKITPSGTNWYNSGASVSITAESNPGFKFGRWSGDAKGKGNPSTVKIDKPKKIKGSFSKERTQAGSKGRPNKPKDQDKLSGTRETRASGVSSSTLTLLGKLENPTGREIVSGVKPIYGWALDGQAVSTVELYVDGVYICDIPHGGIREDIIEAYPDYPEADRSGFALIWNYSVLSSGEHTVLVRVHNTKGETLDLHASVTVVKFHGDLVTTLSSDTNLSQQIDVTADGVTKTYDVNLQWYPERQDFGIKNIIPRD